MNRKVSRKNMVYYLKVWKSIIRAGFRRSYTYKTDVIFRFFRTLFILGVQILLLNAIFGNSDIYAGWTKAEAYLVMGIWNLLNYISWSFFGVNLLYLDSKILEGKFDYILLKPISSSWLSSFGDFFLHNFVTATSGILLISYYMYLEWNNLVLTNVLMSIVSIGIAFLFWYSIYLFFASFSISKPRNGFLSIAKELLGITKYPIDVFGETFKVVFYTVIPVAFLTTVPANLLIGRVGWIYLPISFVISLVLLLLAQKSWDRNVKGYTSASS
ncbi:MAG: ABC transporter permease [Candidatus Dojkabacteria bacterium]